MQQEMIGSLTVQHHRTLDEIIISDDSRLLQLCFQHPDTLHPDPDNQKMNSL